MKKRLEAELISIAHRVLKLKGKENLTQLHAEAQKLYELLSVLKFAEDNFNVIQPAIDINEIENKITNSFDQVIEIEKTEVQSAQSEVLSTEPAKTDKVVYQNIFGDEYKEPVFEKIDTLKIEIESIEAEIETIEAEIEIMESKIDESIEMYHEINLGQKTSNQIHVTLNDKIGFVKHLFDDNHEDYNRVLSQLSTIETLDEAKDFITNMVKPDYNDWTGKADFEERFMAVIAQKFS
jgi:chromosome segregation ATPase